MGGLRGCGRGQNQTFSEYGHVAYQIEADDAGSNMVVYILPTDTPSTQGVGSKGQTVFLKVVMLHIKLKLTRLVANILPTDIPLTQGVGSKGQTISFSERSHVAYQIKGN